MLVQSRIPCGNGGQGKSGPRTPQPRFVPWGAFCEIWGKEPLLEGALPPAPQGFPWLSKPAPRNVRRSLLPQTCRPRPENTPLKGTFKRAPNPVEPWKLDGLSWNGTRDVHPSKGLGVCFGGTYPKRDWGVVFVDQWNRIKCAPENQMALPNTGFGGMSGKQGGTQRDVHGRNDQVPKQQLDALVVEQRSPTKHAPPEHAPRQSSTTKKRE